MSLDQKIGQLFIIPACELRGQDHLEDLQSLLQRGLAGGILLKQGTAAGQRKLIETLQAFSPEPLLCIQDGEWGTAMRLTDTPAFPRNLTLGAVQDLKLLFNLGVEIGRQCRLVGTHINLAPVVDVNCNPQNPIIHMRSFGEDPIQVALRADLLMLGIQSTGVFACMKHFPGHGDTAVDSHVDLPLVAHSRNHLEEVELFPFQQLIASGVKTVMSAHLLVPSLSSKPVTFSPLIITQLLQNEMGFHGLVITDALNMKALSNYYSAGQIAVEAFLAGHDLLLYGDHIAPNIDQILRVDVPEAFQALKSAVLSGKIREEQIDARVHKILQAKEDLGLFEDRSCPPVENLSEQINHPSAHALKRRLFEEAMTLVSNDGSIPLHEGKIALVEWGDAPVFKQKMEDRGVDVFKLEDSARLKDYTYVVLSLAGFNSTPPHFGLKSEDMALFKGISELEVPVVAVVFGTPYCLALMPPFNAVLEAYEKAPEAQGAAAEVLFGLLPAKGRLPINR